MDLATLLTPERVALDLAGHSKAQALGELAALVAGPASVEAGKILDALLQRERLGTTGVGDGIAIPHAKVAGLERIVAAFARLDRPVEFEALDGKPVDLLFLILAPAGAGADHLKALARIARVLRDPALCQQLRRESAPARIVELIVRRQDACVAGG